MLNRAINKFGILGVIKRLPMFFLEQSRIMNLYYSVRFPKALYYTNPTLGDLSYIETLLVNNNVEINDYFINKESFDNFLEIADFPDHYHGGKDSNVWFEKIIEHYIAYDRLDINNYASQDKYVDIAACSSPWARILRENFKINSFAIDLHIHEQFSHLDYYMTQDATATNFDELSIRGVSLQCAFEMFLNNNDMNLIDELHRILQPGGKAIICPLYMHKEYCFYYSPEHHNSVMGKEHEDTYYVNIKARGVPGSRKYDVEKLIDRILTKIQLLDMQYRILVLLNKSEISDDIYCHFILEITQKPLSHSP